MSDTENKTENTTETETVDTAPYMKKPGQNESKTASSKTEILAPAVLMLVLVGIISIIFYNKDHRDHAAQSETVAVIEVETIAPAEDTVAEAQAANEQTSEQTSEQAAVEENTAQTTAAETTEEITTAEIEETAAPAVKAPAVKPPAVKAPAAKEVVVVIEEKTVAVTTPQVPVAAVNKVNMRPAAPYQRMPNSRAQVQTKQRMEMLQQRRQAYEREMQDRRARYESAMKAQQEKRAKIAEAKKAVFQRAQKDRIAAEQKIQALHKQIAKLHEEIHQIMRETRKNAAPVKMHSM